MEVLQLRYVRLDGSTGGLLRGWVRGCGAAGVGCGAAGRQLRPGAPAPGARLLPLELAGRPAAARLAPPGLPACPPRSPTGPPMHTSPRCPPTNRTRPRTVAPPPSIAPLSALTTPRRRSRGRAAGHGGPLQPQPRRRLRLPAVHARGRAGPEPDGRRHRHPARCVGRRGLGWAALAFVGRAATAILHGGRVVGWAGVCGGVVCAGGGHEGGGWAAAGGERGRLCSEARGAPAQVSPQADSRR